MLVKISLYYDHSLRSCNGVSESAFAVFRTIEIREFHVLIDQWFFKGTELIQTQYWLENITATLPHPKQQFLGGSLAFIDVSTQQF